LTDVEVAGLFTTDAAPRDGLVAEFLLADGAGTVAADTAQGNDGMICGAAWATQS
jgi:hypothetical protein